MNETRAARYHRSRVRAGAGAFAAAVLVLLAFGPWLAGSWLAAAVTGVAGLGALGTWTATALFAGIVLGAVQLARFPLERHRDWTLEGRYGLARVPAALWTRGHLRGAAATVALGIAAALFVRSTWDWAGDAWWLVSAGGLLLAHVAWTVTAPLLLVVFGGLRPLRRPDLAARVDALARRAGTRVAIREWRGGDDTTRAHAALAGLGRTRQIILSDTLVDTLRDDEIEVVVAHELAHHVHGDVWRAAAWRAVSLPLALGTAAGALDRLGAPIGSAVAPSAALPWLPVLGALGLTAHRVLEPIGLALARRRELAADAYAIRLTGGADAFVSSMRRLSRTNLLDDRPPRLARLFATHPPVRERVVSALRQAERLPHA
jgi:STE24 endopeptidase